MQPVISNSQKQQQVAKQQPTTPNNFAFALQDHRLGECNKIQNILNNISQRN